MRQPDMALSSQPVTLDGEGPDREGTLVFRDSRLLALLTRLDTIHGELAGRWFVETIFGDLPERQPPAFETTGAFGEWLASPD
jgi:hypothetical protein